MYFKCIIFWVPILNACFNQLILINSYRYISTFMLFGWREKVWMFVNMSFVTTINKNEESLIWHKKSHYIYDYVSPFLSLPSLLSLFLSTDLFSLLINSLFSIFRFLPLNTNVNKHSYNQLFLTSGRIQTHDRAFYCSINTD